MNLRRYKRVIRALSQRFFINGTAQPITMFERACKTVQTYIAHRDADFDFDAQASLFDELCKLREDLALALHDRHYNDSVSNRIFREDDWFDILEKVPAA